LVDINIKYTGELHCDAEHGPSKRTLETEAPPDNQGRGGSFSPTDLVATGLGTCMATLMGIRARARGFDLEGIDIHVKKHMTAAPPRRIARLAVTIRVPAEVTARVLAADARAELEYAANTCPVRLSLLDAIEVPVDWDWQGAT
jgi:putative redox protein